MARRKTNRKTEFEYINNVEDINARREGPTPKKWTLHDLISVHPKTPGQEQMFEDYLTNGKNILAHGSAGTGKSFVALYLAFCDLLSQDTPRDNVRIVRSAVPTRDIGFLPGTLEEKMMQYETPYEDIMDEIFTRSNTYENMKKAGVLHFTPTSFVRGATWDNCVIVIDEVQNCTWHEINSVLTRTGVNSRVIITGDSVQTDICKKGEKSGIEQLRYVVNHMHEFGSVEFTLQDIVRSDFVKSWITATEYAFSGGVN